MPTITNGTPISQGLGFALVIADDTAPLGSWGNKSSWRASGTRNGSPGAADPPPPAFPTVLVNEALSHPTPPLTDAIELFNAGPTEADISGWLLTDDFNQPFKYRIPDGTRLAPGDFRVFTESDFKSGPAGFGLNASGDQAYLFSADASINLTGYVHGFAFGAAEEGVSFRRYVTSTGDEQFVAQIATSLGQTNTGPRVGPLVINEIMFHPPAVPGATNNTRDEFLELRNISGVPISLFDTNSPAQTWQLEGGVTFQFPTSVTIPADGYALVVGFDPVGTPVDLDSFQARYQLGSDVMILGPWSGQLQNSGETIRLLKPNPNPAAASDTTGQPPEVLVDEMDYANTAPWPANANATGYSVQRVSSGAYGNDPVNWEGAFATPAQPNGNAKASIRSMHSTLLELEGRSISFLPSWSPTSRKRAGNGSTMPCFRRLRSSPTRRTFTRG